MMMAPGHAASERLEDEVSDRSHDDLILTHSFPEGVFRRLEPRAQRAPVVIDVSRSGRRYPVEFRPEAPFSAVHSRISMYVDELLALAPGVGATLVCAEFPITVIDPNRAADDLDPAMLSGEWPSALRPSEQSLKNGAGLVHSVGADKIPLYSRKLTVTEVARRLERFYEPYHAELRRNLESIKAARGKVFHLSVHCMSSVDPKNPQGSQAVRPDICLGDRDGTTCDAEFRTLVADAFRKLGYGVSINAPFKGSEIMRRYGSPRTGTHSLQIEICKRLFMDEATGEKSARFERLKGELRELIRLVCRYANQQVERLTGDAI
jgi:N-formylglutamate amidohydrolase